MQQNIQISPLLTPKVDTPQFAAAVAVAAALQLYQVDLVHQPLGLKVNHLIYTQGLKSRIKNIYTNILVCYSFKQTADELEMNTYTNELNPMLY